MNWIKTLLPGILLCVATIAVPAQDATDAPARDAPAAGRANEAPFAASRNRFARRVVEIAMDRVGPEWSQLSKQVNEIATRHAASILNLGPERLAEVLRTRADFNGDQCLLTLTVRLPNDPQVHAAATEFADQIVTDLRAYTDQLRRAKSDELAAPDRQELDAAREQLERAVKEHRELRAKLREQTGRLNVSPERIEDQAAELDEEALRLEVEQAAKQARRDALAAAMADASKRVDEQVQRDEIVAELQKIVDSRQKAIERARTLLQQGAIGEGELQQATEALSEARAKLLERQREAAGQAGGDVLADWNRELLSLSVDERELMARLQNVRARLEKIRALVESGDDMRRMREQIERSRAAIDEAQARLRDTAARLREMEQERRVSVREAEDGRDAPIEDPAEPATRER
jgi:hypothetical protein